MQSCEELREIIEPADTTVTAGFFFFLSLIASTASQIELLCWPICSSVLYVNLHSVIDFRYLRTLNLLSFSNFSFLMRITGIGAGDFILASTFSPDWNC